LRNKYPKFTLVQDPYHRVADNSDYWVFIAPIRIGWFVPGNPEKDREELSSVWKVENRKVKDEVGERHGEKCWMPGEKIG
jgi:hypothetical protein